MKTKKIRQLCYEHLKTLSDDEIREVILPPISPSTSAQGSGDPQELLGQESGHHEVSRQGDDESKSKLEGVVDVDTRDQESKGLNKGREPNSRRDSIKSDIVVSGEPLTEGCSKDEVIITISDVSDESDGDLGDFRQKNLRKGMKPGKKPPVGHGVTSSRTLESSAAVREERVKSGGPSKAAMHGDHGGAQPASAADVKATGTSSASRTTPPAAPAIRLSRRPPPPPPTTTPPPPATNRLLKTTATTISTTAARPQVAIRRVPPPPPPTPPPPAASMTVAAAPADEGTRGEVRGRTAVQINIPTVKHNAKPERGQGNVGEGYVIPTSNQGGAAQGSRIRVKEGAGECSALHTSDQASKVSAGRKAKGDHILHSTAEQLSRGWSHSLHSRPGKAPCDERTGQRDPVESKASGGGRLSVPQDVTQPSKLSGVRGASKDPEALTVGSAKLLEMELRQRALEAELRRNNTNRHASTKVPPHAHHSPGSRREKSAEEERDGGRDDGEGGGGFSEGSDGMYEDVISLHPDYESSEEEERESEVEQGGSGRGCALKVRELLEERLRQRALQAMLEKKKTC
jgi:hypothetical protein